jgi:hypothetical protein
MLDFPEENIPYFLARDYYSGAGEIVEIGSFLGASAFSFAKGLNGSATVTGRDRVGRLRCFDLFRYSENPMKRFLGDPELAQSMREGDDTLPLFNRYLAGYSDFVRPVQGDILEQRWDGGPIEILYVDVAHTEAIFDHILRHFFPHLIPGRSIVVHQDYGFVFPWLQYRMEQLADFFAEKAAFINVSAVFWTKDTAAGPAYQDAISRRLPDHEKLALMDRLMRRRSDGFQILLHGCAKAVLLAQTGAMAEAGALIGEVRQAANGNPIILRRTNEAVALIQTIMPSAASSPAKSQSQSQSLDRMSWVELNTLRGAAARQIRERWPDQDAFNLERIQAVAQTIWTRFGGSARVAGADCLEVGAGPFNPLGTGAVLVLNGARRAWSTDFGPAHDEWLIARGLYEFLANCLAFPERWNFAALSPAEWDARVHSFPLADLERGDLSTLAERTEEALRYVPLDLAKKVLPAHCFDVLFTTAVMEHVRDVPAEHAWYRRLLRPRGFVHHQIDLKDHRAYENPGRVDIRAFMIDGEYGPTSTLRSDLVINGLRASDHRMLLEQAGFKILDWAPRHVVMDETFRARLRPEFSHRDEEDLTVVAVDVLGQAI